MAKEIERKYLIKNDSYRAAATDSIEIAQGYLSADPDRTVRIRIAGNTAFITVKTRNDGAIRNEWEYPIPPSEARDILAEAKTDVISKTRYFIPAEHGLFWEVDCFHGSLEGLVIAEIELPSEDTEYALPDFIGEEVTGDPRYYNSNLAVQV